jgi:hypothetical protein
MVFHFVLLDELVQKNKLARGVQHFSEKFSICFAVFGQLLLDSFE